VVVPPKEASLSILVAYASKHGSTKGIAERIAERLAGAGLKAEALPVEAVGDVNAYDGAVLGSALYMFHWLGDARSFARRNRAALAGKPLWLFSSGPIGPDKVDKQGRDVRDVSGPRELDELRRTLRPRDHRVFFGAWDIRSKPVGFWERMAKIMPATKSSMPDGDFRDWANIDAWADGIAAQVSKGARGSP
jgi:menaquinone-dependent protoporphyrinogen oxidase